MEALGHVFQYRVWYAVGTRGFVVTQLISAHVINFFIEVCVEWNVRCTSFFKCTSVQIMPRILSDITGAIVGVNCLVVASRYSGFIGYGLL